MKELETLQAILTDVPEGINLVKEIKEDKKGNKEITFFAPVPFDNTKINRIIIEGDNGRFNIVFGLWLTVSKKFIEIHNSVNCSLSDVEAVLNLIKENFLKLKAEKTNSLATERKT